MKDVKKHGLTIQVDDEGREWINGVEITMWDVNNRPRNKSQFIKGVSGNPHGMPKYTENKRAEVMKQALAFSEEGLDILIGFARDKKERTPTRIKAIEVIFDRGLGKPQDTREEQLTPGELVSALPDIFFPGGVKPDVDAE